MGSANGVDFVVSSKKMLVKDVPSLFSISPLSGIVTGGTNVYASGVGFSGEAGQCQFGDALPVPFVVLNNTVLRCTSPAYIPGTVIFRLKFENLDEYVGIEGGSTFEFENAPVVVQIHPSEGSEMGGTNVRVMGVNFKRSDLLSCSF